MPEFKGIFPCNQGLDPSNFSRHLLVQITDRYTVLEVLLELKPTQISKRGERTKILLTQSELEANYRTAPFPSFHSYFSLTHTRVFEVLPKQCCSRRLSSPGVGCHQTTQWPMDNTKLKWISRWQRTAHHLFLDFYFLLVHQCLEHSQKFWIH